MPSYVLPQALIYQEFTLAPTALTEPLRACPVGPQYALFRYSDSDEKATIKVTDSYEPDADESFLWPGRPAGGVVDTDYTQVYIDDALLQYYSDPGGDASNIQVVDGYRNRIRFDALVLQTKNGFSRSGVFLDRDVAVGDVLDISASACGDPYSIRAQILELVADEIPAVIDAAEAESGNNATQSESSSYDQTAGALNNVCIESVDTSGYDGREDGQISETYEVEVVKSGSGGDAETAILRVTALSGTEDPVEITPEDFGVATDIGGRGLTVTFNNDGCGSSSSPSAGVDADDFIVGQKWQVEVNQQYTVPTVSSGGTYLGAYDTTYIVEVSKGGDIGTAEVRISTTTGVDASGPVVVTALGTAVVVGTQGVTLTFVTGPQGLVTGDRFLIGVETVGEGAVKTVVLSTPLPPALRGICEVIGSSSSSSSSSGTPPDLAVIFYIKKDIEVEENREGYAPLVNWEQSETQITTKAGIIAYDATWTNGGVMQPLPVKDGEVYVSYRALIFQWVGSVGTISDVSDINDQFSQAAVIDQDNPLVYGVYNALLNSNGEDVKFTAVGASSPMELEDWIDALEVLKGRSDVYSLVPLTYDKEVIDAFVSHVEAMSAADVGRWRIAWFTQQAVTEKAVYTTSLDPTREGEVVLATITDDPDTTGTQYTLVTAEGEKFLTGGVSISPGDIVRAQYQDDGFGNTTYSEYVIDAVQNDEEIRLVSGPSSPIITPSKIEIWRNLNKTQIATEMALKPGLWTSRRAYLVWPDEVGNAGETVPGYFLCCSLAGLRGASLPHRPLTNVEIIGWDDLTRTTEFFNEPQLNTLAAAGWWIVTRDPNDGTVYTRHQLSTNNLDLNRKEQSVTTNVDSISYTLLNRLKVYIGRGNVTPVMLGIVEGEILSVLDYFSNFTVQDILGPQIISYEIARLEQSELLKDRIIADIPIVIPYPFNNAEVHLII
jgi:hypothetical protein